MIIQSLIRPLVQPLVREIRYSGGSSLLDTDAAAIVAAVRSAGGTVTGAQTAAIDTFVRTGKGEGWYSLLRRFYLPIWGAAGPNAVDWITRGSGSFEGGVTHGAGFVQGDGSTGYFLYDLPPASFLSTNLEGHFMLVLSTPATNVRNMMGGRRTSGLTSRMRTDSTVSSVTFSGSEATGDLRGRVGIFSAHRTATAIKFYNRRAADRVLLGQNDSPGTHTLVNHNYVAMAANGATSGFTIGGPHNGQIGGWGHFENADGYDEDITFAIKTLWETCTGLTLP